METICRRQQRIVNAAMACVLTIKVLPVYVNIGVLADVASVL